MRNNVSELALIRNQNSMEKEFWTKKFDGFECKTQLPFYYKSSVIQVSITKGEELFVISNDIFQLLKKISKDDDFKLHIVLLAGFVGLINRYSDINDILIGVPTYKQEVEASYINCLLPLRFNVSGKCTFKEVLEETRDCLVEAEENQNFPFEEIIGLFDKENNNFVEFIVSLENIHCSLENNVNSDFIFSFFHDNDKLQLCVKYNYLKYSSSVVQNIFDHYTFFLKNCLEHPNSTIHGLDLIDESEKKKIIELFNSNKVDVTKLTIHELFEEQVRRTPNNIAVKYKDKKITYLDLNSRANCLAKILRKKGAQPNKVISVMMNRSIDMIVAVLGILKSGGAYLPIDPNYPAKRINYLLKDSNTDIIVTEESFLSSLNQVKTVVNISSVGPIDSYEENLVNLNQVEDLVYVIYTSGSTGEPKGVMVQHNHLENVAQAWIKEYHLLEFQVNLLQIASFSFDVFCGDIARALLVGGTLVICPEDYRLDFPVLYNYIADNQINIFESTPGIIIPFMDYVYQDNKDIDFLKLLIIGSDILSIEDYRNLLARFRGKTRIINSYGITETTIDSSYFESSIDYDFRNNLPIGKPLPNVNMYVLSPLMNIQPIEVLGELYIGGTSVSRGYWNNKKLTEERFIKNPFESGGSLYKTGDLARWLPDGNIEFLGRSDNQVKIRGFRIELKEIESIIKKHAQVNEVVVVGIEKDEKFLCAYLVGKKLEDNDLREYLKDCLPSYMIPSSFVWLNKIPLTPNGKIDRHALPEPVIESSFNYVTPSNEIEEKLLAIWSEILHIGKEKISVTSDFFELGGHSLKATVLVSKIHKELEVQISLSEIFKYQTIQEQAKNIQEKQKHKYISIQKAEPQPYYKLSSAQSRLYFLYKYQSHSLVYNISYIATLEGNIERDKLVSTMRKLISRHESLCTSFEIINDQVVQKISDQVDFDIEYFDSNEDEVKHVMKNFIRHFALNKAPLMRIGIIRLLPKKHIMMIDMHHIITDGTSMGILIKDFVALYNNEELPELRIQYKDYAEWQQGEENQKAEELQKEFWVNEFSEDYNVLELPTDFKRKLIPTFDGSIEDFVIGKEETDKLKEIAKTTDTTLFMVLLSIYNVLLSKLSNQEDIIVGIAVAGRQTSDLQNIVGVFVNTLPLRNFPQGSLPFKEFLLQLKTRTISCFDKQSYQYDDLIEHLKLKRSTNRNPLFDAAFSFDNFNETELKIPGLTLIPYKRDYTTAKFDITLNAVERGNEILLNFEYSTDLFKKESILNFITFFRRIVKAIILDKNQKISSIEILSKEEKNQILHEFNDTKVDYPKNKTVIDLFSEQAIKFPNSIAVTSELIEPIELWPSISEYFVYDDLLYHAMIADVKRNMWYEKDIRNNVKGKIVVEVGTGPEAILSRLCIEAGAAKVYAIEILEDTYNKADQCIKRLKLEDKIHLIYGDAAKVSLPEKADVCLSELVGSIGGSEGAAVILNKARRFLKDTGIMIPSKTITKIVPISLPDYFINEPKFSKISSYYLEKVFQYLGSEYDIRLCLKNFSKQYFLSESQIFENLDFTKPRVEEQSTHSLEFEIKRDDTLQGFLVWLNLISSENDLLDITDHEYCWLPAFIPVFYPGVKLKQGSKIKAKIYRTLCENGINPDFKIKGEILIENNEKIEFDYDLPHFPKQFKGGNFYKKIFNDNAKVKFYPKEKICLDITYDILNKKSNQLAKVLNEKGVSRSDIVCLLMNDSIDTIINILGILKVSGIYMPIDPKTPINRLRAIINDSKPKILLTTKKLRDELINPLLEKTDSYFSSLNYKDAILVQEDLIEEISNKSQDQLATYCNSNDIAYIIYTSGSTGKPKGVVISHKGLYNLVQAQVKGFGIENEDKVLQFASLGFDASISEIFTSLSAGATLVIFSRGTDFNLDDLYDVLKSQKITVATFPPSVLRILQNENLDSLKTIVSAGESCDWEIVNKWKPGRTFINAYGPTEYTVCATMNIIKQELSKNITIGKPISNSNLFILGLNNELQPINILGEINILGDGIALGYMNNSDLTKERFIPNPFGNGTIYKTGDLARWLPDGNIEFFGRKDNQIKLRGNRIEIGEIERQLALHEQIKDAVVIVKEQEGEKYLIGYYVSEQEIIVGELRTYLGTILPDYMIPLYFIRLEKLPSTPNGKLDRKALPDPEIGESIEYKAPKNEKERQLVRIWSEILQIKEERIGINSNFFELGGHSLRTIGLISKLHKVFNQQVPLTEIFKKPTIRGIAEYLGDAVIEKHSSIPKAEKKEYYRISSAQYRLYILQQFDNQSTAYNLPAIFELEGNVDYNNIKRTFELLIEKHENLRTSFVTINGEHEPQQRIESSVEFSLPIVSVSTEGILKEITDFIRSFDLSLAPLFRAKLLRLTESRHILIYDMHHIISDGITTNNIIVDFKELYSSRGENKHSGIQYKDYSEWYSRFLKTEKIRSQEEYWKTQFEEEVPILELPTDYIRPSIQSFEGRRIDFEIGKMETEKLKVLAKETGCTLYMVLLSIYKILLSKLSGQEDIIVGTPIAGRRHTDMERVVGVFVNTLAIRSYPKGGKAYQRYLEEIKNITLRSFENSDYPYEKFVEQLSIRRDTSRNALFDVVFVLQNMTISEFSLPGLTIRPYKHLHTTSKFDLTLTATEKTDGINFSFEYSTLLFSQGTIERFLRYFKEIIKVIQANRQIRLSEIEIIPTEEKHKLLEEYNHSTAFYPKEKRIHEFFEEQVKNNPKGVALILEGQQMTYGELNNRSNQLAHLLISKGVSSDVIVGLMLDRSFEMIIGILGILKAGGAYLPIDPTYPEERKKYILGDSNVDILLTSKKSQSDQGYSQDIVYIDEIYYQGEEISNPKKNGSSKDLAYVIYTSGSTGKPKGALIEHRNVVSLLFPEGFQFEFTSEDVWTMFHSYCFDFSVWEMYGALFYGGKLVIVPKIVSMDTRLFIELLKRDKVSVLNQTPSAFYNLSRHQEAYEVGINLRYVIFGGEALSPSNLKQWKERYPGTKMINMYGITETTVHVSYKEITENEIESGLSNIGKPIPSLQAYIFDDNLKLVPEGVTGELFIGGEGVCRGYLDHPELSQMRFIDNPYKEGELIYVTGDLGKWLSNGDIEYLGRKDSQVKIRGFRIELGEIESVIRRHINVEEVLVLDKEGSTREKYLCAYLVGEKIADSELRSYISVSLPTYMVPSFFVWLEKMPLTSNGKIDRKALPNPDIGEGAGYEAPRNETEKNLVKIWSEVLQVEEAKIGITNDFFDLGGHSLRATVLVSKIHKEFNRRIPLAEIFKNPTIRGISEYIGNTQIAKHKSIPQAEKKEYYSLSSAQRRLYIVQQLDVNSVAYNMPQVVLLEDNVTKKQINSVLKDLVSRHESLRTSFKIIEESPVQVIHDNVEINVEDYNSKIIDINTIKYNFIRPFDLSIAPLFRVGFMEGAQEHKFLLLDVHHIITDGVSYNLLIKEFRTLLKGEKLKPVNLQYKDYSEWLETRKHKLNIKKQESYWLGELSGELPKLELPTDNRRPKVKSYEGSNIKFELSEEQTRQIKQKCNEYGVSLYMYLISVFKILLSKLSGQEDIIVGMPIAGRPQVDLQEVVGIFVNMLPLRSSLKSEKIFANYLKELKIKMIEAYENQEYQFEDLVNKISVIRDTSRNPVFDVVFNFLNHMETELYEQRTENNEINFTKISSQFDLNVASFENAEKINFNVEYSNSIFSKETIERIVSYYKTMLDSVTKYPDQKISEIEFLSKNDINRYKKIKKITANGQN